MKSHIIFSILFVFIFLIYGVTINTSFIFLITQSILGIFGLIKINKGIYLQDIRMFFILSFTLYSVFLPLISMIGLIDGFTDYLPQTTILYGLSLFSFNTFTLFKKRKWNNLSNIESNSKGFFIPISLLFFLVLYSIYYMKSSGISVFTFGENMSSRTELGSIVTQLWIVLSFMIITITTFLIFNFQKLNNKSRLIFVLIIILYVIFQFSLGNRRQIAGIIFFSISFILSFFRKKMNFKTIVILSILFIGSFAISILRDANTRTLDRAGQIEVALASNEFIYPMQTTYYLLKNNWDFRFGSTYIFLPFQLLIPRIIYPGKPSTLGGEFIIKTFGKRFRQGFAYTPVSEAYLNFGYIGPLIMFFFLGVFFDFLLKINYTNLNYVYFMFYGLVFDFCRGDFGSIFYAVFVMYVVYRLVYFSSKFRLKFNSKLY